MYDHFLLITTSHKSEHRMAWHKILVEREDYDYVEYVLKKVEKKVGDLNFSSHIITTSNEDVTSIQKKDQFFKDVVFFEEEDYFIDIYKKELTLNANDVATFIISQSDDITHLKLQKLLYLCYEDFLKNTGVPLFEDKIYAFPYGPVVKNVFNKYSHKGKDKIEFKEDNSVTFPKMSTKVTPSFSRILFSETGIGALNSIQKTLEKYVEKSAFDLVDITHRPGSAWDRVYEKDVYSKEITPEIIEQSVGY